MAAIRNGRFTSTPVFRSAQEAAIPDGLANAARALGWAKSDADQTGFSALPIEKRCQP